MKTALLVSLLVAALGGGYAFAQDTPADSSAQGQPKDGQVAVVDHAKHCSKDMKGSTDEAAKDRLIKQKGKSVEEK